MVLSNNIAALGLIFTIAAFVVSDSMNISCQTESLVDRVRIIQTDGIAVGQTGDLSSGCQITMGFLTCLLDE